MSRQVGTSVENNFVGGLKTDFSGLNFPENACTETYNCVFNKPGTVYRRYGIDFESNATTTTIDRTGVAVTTYVWKNVAGDGNVNLLVVQIGGTLYFYDASIATSANPLSNRKIAATITLSTFTASGVSIPLNECQFAEGNGYLFVVHPGLEPFYVAYDTAAQTFTSTAITVKIRDFTGIAEAGVIDTSRPTSLTDSHRYNLGNQGWMSHYLGTSTTSIAVGTGSKVFTTQSTLGIVVGDRVRVYSLATPGSLGPSTATGNIMIGTVTAYSGTTLTVNVTSVNGSGTLTDWRIVQEPDNLGAWFVAFANYPSNCDVWWLYKNSSDVFAPGTKYLDKLPGNSPAAKGGYILSAFSEDRAVASGITGLATATTSGARPTTVAFFQGRVFYAGVQYVGYNAKIYYSQIIERPNQFGLCYQQNDPTSEDAFDLLPADGGVIQIQGAGTIIKMHAVQGALLVFATNGVWLITGSQALGFQATDYTVAAISGAIAASASSFVSVLGYPMFWATEGIYAVTPGQNGLEVQSITNGQISSFFAGIPAGSKRFARGFYNPFEFTVQWIYRTTEAENITQTYEFDGILNLNTIIQAFYPWVVGDGNPTINGISVVSGSGGSTVENTVVDGSAVTVVDGSGATVVTFSTGSNTVTVPVFKYLSSYTNAGSYKFTFAEHYDTSYLDWDTNATGIDYSSYFLTGYKVHGDAQRKFQPNYVYLYSLNDEPTSYRIQGVWSFANSGGSGQFTSQQRVTSPETIDLDGVNYDIVYRRHKIRGHGVAVQLKILSNTGLPFKIVGWSIWETANASI